MGTILFQSLTKISYVVVHCLKRLNKYFLTLPYLPTLWTRGSEVIALTCCCLRKLVCPSEGPAPYCRLRRLFLFPLLSELFFCCRVLQFQCRNYRAKTCIEIATMIKKSMVTVKFVHQINWIFGSVSSHTHLINKFYIK